MTGLIFALVGVIAVVGSLQTLYERVFEHNHRGWRDLPRFVVWMGVLLAVLVAEGNIDTPLRSRAGPVIQTVLGYVAATIVFGWTMRFLLAGRVKWRQVVRPALITCVLWVALAGFSSLYFSSVIIDDSRLHGTIGVVFTLLTWFILIGAVIAIGAMIGAVWQQRSDQHAHTVNPDEQP
ncbi:MAG: YhjD/YihY/BrkB family envelope integrity protein [Solirubrobacteraceae bacterium]